MSLSTIAFAAAPVKTPRVVRYCTNCATVEAVRVIEMRAGNSPATGLGRSPHRYEVVIRYTNGGRSRTLAYDNDPGLRVGEKVKVNDGVLTRDQ